MPRGVTKKTRGSVRIEGLFETQQALEALGERSKVELARALRAEAQAVAVASQALVPRDTGALAASMVVRSSRGTGKSERVSASVSYGSTAAPYALAVHELSPSRRRHTNGQWLYLVTPYRAALAGLEQRVANRLRAVVRGLGR